MISSLSLSLLGFFLGIRHGAAVDELRPVVASRTWREATGSM